MVKDINLRIVIVYHGAITLRFLNESKIFERLRGQLITFQVESMLSHTEKIISLTKPRFIILISLMILRV